VSTDDSRPEAPRAHELSDAALSRLAREVGQALHQAGWRVVTAESCTGGWVAKCITDVPGSSQWFERGYVTYSNDAKQQQLGVSLQTLESSGAVSAIAAAQMAEGALAASRTEIAIAVTGIAGPDGGSAEKPVGLVCFALARGSSPVLTHTQRFAGDREAVRRAAVATALRLVLNAARAAAPHPAGQGR